MDGACSPEPVSIRKLTVSVEHVPFQMGQENEQLAS